MKNPHLPQESSELAPPPNSLLTNSFEASRESRRREKGHDRHDTIIALTANALAGDKDRCFEVGMDAYLSKPLDKAKFYTMIRKYSVEMFRRVEP